MLHSWYQSKTEGLVFETSRNLSVSPRQAFRTIIGACVLQTAVNGIGGIHVVFPILEQAGKGKMGEDAPIPTRSMSITASGTGTIVQPSEDLDDWEVLPSSSYAGGYNLQGVRERPFLRGFAIFWMNFHKSPCYSGKISFGKRVFPRRFR